MSEITVPTDEKSTLALWDHVAEQYATITTAISDEGLRLYFEKFRAEAEAEVRVKGIRLPQADDVLDEVEYKHRQSADQAAAKDTLDFLKRLHALEDGLRQQAEAAATLQPPKPASHAEHWMATTAHILERQELRTLAAGWTLAELVAHYERIPDVDNPGLVGFIEAELRAGFPSLRMKAATDSLADAAAMKRLTTLVHARHDARVPLHVQEVRARIRATLTPLRRMLLKDLARGKHTPAVNGYKKTPRTAGAETAI